MASAARRGRPFWEKLVEDYQASGKAHVAFALERGVSVSTFRQWLYKLRTELPAQAPSRPALRRLPVTVAGSAPNRSAASMRRKTT
ncbi:hypothetical protein A7982_14002 [Minicystis rosea]|nr:hypothetical protein A7982_14002 [Minicystis rosea]